MRLSTESTRHLALLSCKSQYNVEFLCQGMRDVMQRGWGVSQSDSILYGISISSAWILAFLTLREGSISFSSATAWTSP